jgi:hypothetical protein
MPWASIRSRKPQTSSAVISGSLIEPNHHMAPQAPDFYDERIDPPLGDLKVLQHPPPPPYPRGNCSADVIA